MLVGEVGQMTTPAPGVAPTGRSAARPAVWAFHMLLPLLGLWVLLARPALDLRWLDQGAHFAVVATAALAGLVLAWLVNDAARRRADVRLFLVGLVFLTSSGCLLIHAMATPGVLLERGNPGFELGVPVGLALSSVLAAVSGVDLPPPIPDRLLRAARGVQLVLVGAVLVGAAATVFGAPPLTGELSGDQAAELSRISAVIGVPLYLISVVCYFRLYRRRPSVVLLSVLTAYLLLAEALLVVPLGRLWHMSWWLWHVVMLVGFGYVAYAAHVKYRREGSAAGLFDGVGARQIVERLRGEYAVALESLVDAIRHREQSDDPALSGELARLAAGVADRFGLSEGQVAVLGRAAEALAGERAQSRRLGALAGLGHAASVILPEHDLLERSLRWMRGGFPDRQLQIGLLENGRLRFPPSLSTDLSAPDVPLADRVLTSRTPLEDDSGGLMLPLQVKGRGAGVLHVRRGHGGSLDPRERALLEPMATQLSTTLENARLYQQIDGLFHQYMSPDVASALLADPAQAALGGAQVEVTALFADMRGFTTFSETATPHEIVALLNRYLAVATAAVLAEGGTVVQFVGDALMALFNAPARQPDHPVRAARAALSLQHAVTALAGPDPASPRFRVGVNTGPALVGNIGSEQLRNFNAMGDAVNVAARLQDVAEPGTVVIGEDTLRYLDQPRTTPLGPLPLKGRQAPVSAFVLHALGAGDQP